jgi:hypothetical protein
VEPQVPAALGEIREERDEGVGVALAGRPQSQRGAVAQDHVDGVDCGGVRGAR